MVNFIDNENGRTKTCFRNGSEVKTNSRICNNGNQNKNLLQSYNNISNTMRIANFIQNSNGLGKKTYFGNDYTQNSFLVTYLGKTEGQPGGIGSPLRNKF